MSKRRVELLADHHHRDPFACGVPDLDDFLRKRAGQYRRRDLAVTYVLVQDEDPTVLGYSTIAAASVSKADLPNSIGRKLPDHPGPAALIGRLAVDKSIQGQGAGGLLIADVVNRCVRIAEKVGRAVIHLHAIDDRAAAFYRRFQFTPLAGHPDHLFITIATARKLVPPGTHE